MYEEAASVPWIMAGEDIPEGTACNVPVTHVDAYPTVLEACGVAANDEDTSRQGASLFAIMEGATPERTILSEYHAMGSKGGAFMIRNGKYKFVYYVLYRPQLFDLEADPEELNDLAEDPSFADVLRGCESKLRRICDPEEVDARCKARQAELIERNGGRQVILERGDFGFSPAPGTEADFR
jgi:choline-sulfatase